MKIYTLKKVTNRLLKGKMWSAIPIALLCMILNWSEGKQGSGPKGSTQGDFRSSCVKKWMRCYTGLQEPKLRSKKADVRPENANLKLERADLRLESAGLRLERSEN